MEFFVENVLKPFAKAVFLASVLMVGIAIGQQTPPNSFSPKSPNTVTVTLDGGGEIFSFYQKYTDMRVSGKNLRVEGFCASACTFFMSTMPHDRVCATEYARFGFHGIYSMNILGETTPNFEMYKWFMPLVYPDWLLEKLRNEYGFDGRVADVDKEKYPGGIIWMTRDDLNLQHCEDVR